MASQVDASVDGGQPADRPQRAAADARPGVAAAVPRASTATDAHSAATADAGPEPQPGRPAAAQLTVPGGPMRRERCTGKEHPGGDEEREPNAACV